MDILRDPTYGKRNRAVAIILGALILVPLALWVIVGSATASYLLGALAIFAVLAFLGRHMFAPGIHWTHLQRGSMPPAYRRQIEDSRDRATYQERHGEQERR